MDFGRWTRRSASGLGRIGRISGVFGKVSLYRFREETLPKFLFLLPILPAPPSLGPVTTRPHTETASTPSQRPLPEYPRASPGRSRPLWANTPRQPPLRLLRVDHPSRFIFFERLTQKNPHTANDTQPIVINRKSTIDRTTSTSIDKARRGLSTPSP